MRSANFRYLVGVDHLRGIAALVVLLYHGNQLIAADYSGRFFDPLLDRGYTSWNPVKAVISEGQLGVSLFMVLSGFIFVTGLLGRDYSVPLFFYNRLVRIFPLYVFLIALAVGLYTQTSFGALLQVLVPFAGFTPSAVTDVGIVRSTGLLWTVIVEVQFYLVFPFLMAWVDQRRFWLLARLVLLLVVLRGIALVAGDVNMGGLYFTIWGHLDEFVCGMVAAWLFRHRADAVRRWRWALLVGGLGGWTLLALAAVAGRVAVDRRAAVVAAGLPAPGPRAGGADLLGGREAVPGAAQALRRPGPDDGRRRPGRRQRTASSVTPRSTVRRCGTSWVRSRCVPPRAAKTP